MLHLDKRRKSIVGKVDRNCGCTLCWDGEHRGGQCSQAWRYIRQFDRGNPDIKRKCAVRCS